MRTLMRRLISLAAAGALLAFSAAAAAADGPAPSGVIRVDLAGASAGSQILSLPQGKSAIIELPVDARDILVTNPAVADAVLRSPRNIYLLGVAAGQTDATFFDAAGRRILSLNIRVDQNFGAVAQTIERLIPGSQIRVEGVNNSIVLSGQVANLADADKAVQIAAQYTQKPEQVVNLLSIAGRDQVLLKVRIVEVQRSVVKQLGFNLSGLIGQAGSPQFLAAVAPTWGVNGALLGGLTGGFKQDTTQQPQIMKYDPVTSSYDLPVVCKVCTNGGSQTISTIKQTAGSTGLNQAAGSVEAFEQVGLVRTLAEPNLTAISGEAAKFLAGGEFPVPTGEDNTGRTTIEFKPYGVGLGFTPVVLSNGRISLKISTEVSELTTVGAFSLATSSSSGSGSTLSIPGLNVRRAETTVELPSGGAMMIAGLLKEETKEDIASLPGLMTLPVLGALFRSRDYQAGETELMVIVTPYLVKPTTPDKLQTPADGLEIADDAETLLLGRLNKVYDKRPAPAADHPYQGPVGYVIE